jgi:hypothetical protein
MRWPGGSAQHPCVTKFRTPLDAVSAVLQDPRLPAGDDERCIGFVVISEKTARNHVERTYAKIGVSNRIGASMYALRHGLVKNT